MGDQVWDGVVGVPHHRHEEGHHSTGGDNKKEIRRNFNNIPKLEVDDFNMKNQSWNMKYNVE